jgi:hypothetical protein
MYVYINTCKAALLLPSCCTRVSRVSRRHFLYAYACIRMHTHMFVYKIPARQLSRFPAAVHAFRESRGDISCVAETAAPKACSFPFCCVCVCMYVCIYVYAMSVCVMCGRHFLRCRDCCADSLFFSLLCVRELCVCVICVYVSRWHFLRCRDCCAESLFFSLLLCVCMYVCVCVCYECVCYVWVTFLALPRLLRR